MALFFYNIFLLLYNLSVRIASLFNPKARKWVEGRKNIFKRLEQEIGSGSGNCIIWIHCASLGEFEQGRPVLEGLKAIAPDHKILLTFFSPSGYEVQKNYKGADWIFYLPMDGSRRSNRFLEIVKPELVIFVKYEFWYHYLKSVHKRSIPLLLVSAHFRDGQPFFKWYGGLHRRMLSFFDRVFVQDARSAKLLESIHLKNPVMISGDTRFDRVAEIAEKFQPIPFIREFAGSSRLFVAGSTWWDDEEMLYKVWKESRTACIKLIIAPHELGEQHLRQIEEKFEGAIRYSRFKPEKDGNAAVLIIDNIGMLSRLYRYAHVAYVGGGFTPSGIHNILEAAVFGKPVIFGPNYSDYREAMELLNEGGAWSVDDSTKLSEILESLIKSEEKYRAAGKTAEEYVRKNKGATRTILGYIQENRLLTR